MASHDPTAEALVPRAKPRRTVVVLAAAVVSGIAGYLVLVLTARHLDAAENADFLVFWAALFSVFGVLVGIATETTRAVFAGESSEATPSGGVRVVPAARAQYRFRQALHDGGSQLRARLCAVGGGAGR